MNKLPATQIMYRALKNRDTAFEGIFYIAVKTTGIFCRPTCPAKKPKPENVKYFASPQEALHVGYRPCLRCHPMENEKRPPMLVQQLREIVEQSPIRKVTDSTLRQMGIDPSTARRQFQRYYGLTFHSYHRARRMGLALKEVHGGENVITAQLNNGFESASGFWEAFKKVFGEAPSRANGLHCLHARWIETPLGAMIALANEDGLHLLEFADCRGLENEIAALRKRTGHPIVPGNNPHLERLAEELRRYFEGSAMQFTVPLITAGTPFEQSVWKFLRTIPPGETWSYAQLARKIRNPKAVRAVGHANGKNCLAVIIPCHRVIRADGSIGGYGGSVWRKRWLLQHEKRSKQKLA